MFRSRVEAQNAGGHATTRTVTVSNLGGQQRRGIVNNRTHHQANKHIEVKFFYKNELVKDGVIDVRFVPTTRMLADIFTKPLARPLYSRFLFMIRSGQPMPEKDGISLEEGHAKYPGRYDDSYFQ
jgi:hypothetical protein